jgi:uncharacterized membrane protein YgdD (TMEM256/DUF423 family)
MNVVRVAGVAGALAAALAVGLGAFGAHALRATLGPDDLAVWRTAVDYQFWHALGLLVVALVAQRSPSTLRVTTIAFIGGIVLFCASLYALALGAPRALGMLTPVGGVAFIVGWMSLAMALLRPRH